MGARSRHGGNRSFFGGMATDADCSRKGGTQGTGFLGAAQGNRQPEDFGDHLRPVRRPGAAAGQGHPVDPRAGGGQHIHMAAMLEPHAFVERAQEVAFVMPSGEAVEPAAAGVDARLADPCGEPGRIKRIGRLTNRLEGSQAELRECIGGDGWIRVLESRSKPAKPFGRWK
jgi:hypothetical protein